MTKITHSGTEKGYFYQISVEKFSSLVTLDIFNQYSVRVKHGLYSTTKQAKSAAKRFLNNK